jgi:citrate lyase subunit beta / citryl-CoA lyase
VTLPNQPPAAIDRSRTRPRRACLSVPGSSAKMLGKAAGLAVDMVVIDLEDAVAPSEKETARATVVEAITTLDWGDRIIGVRVNDWTSRWTVGDLTALVAGAGSRLDVVVLPKTEDPGMVRALDLVLGQLEAASGLPAGGIGIEVQIETAAGVEALAAICGVSPRLEAVLLGPLDMTASLGMPARAAHGRRRLDHICSAMVVAGRAAGIQVIDGPYADIRDLDGLATDAGWAAELGFDGKWVLHPDQVAPVERAFSPSPEELEQARAVLAAMEAATNDEGRGAALLGGEMIDEASARIARGIVARGERSGKAE